MKHQELMAVDRQMREKENSLERHPHRQMRGSDQKIEIFDIVTL